MSACGFFERRFGIRRQGSTPLREVLGGLTTFSAMSYILFMQPAMLSQAGMSAASVFLATALAAALATFAMGWWARYPIALAPGVGQNAFFTFTLCGTLGLLWREALALTVVSGLLFLLLGTMRFRERIVAILSPSLRHAIAAGIGLLIAMVGLQWAGLVVRHPATLVGFGSLDHRAVQVALAGLALTLLLRAWGLRAAILLGLLGTALLASALDLLEIDRIAAWPRWSSEAVFALDFSSLLQRNWALVLNALLILFALDLFDTVGTLVGVTTRGALARDGKIERLGAAFASDAAGTVIGGLVGTSTVTSYVESAAGIEAGARTGAASLVTALCFVLALFFQPLVMAVGAPVAGPGGAALYPVIAPALIVVGFAMCASLRHVDWECLEEGFPAFLAIVLMPLTLSITEGIALAILAQVFLLAVRGRWRRLQPALLIVAGFFLLRYLFPLGS